MNLYRLDYESPDGTLTAVSDWRGDYLTRSHATARADALKLACETGVVIRCTRISGAGAMKVMWHASGETRRIHRA
jgi:hypothetical protein